MIIIVFFSTLSIQAQQSIAGLWNTGKDNTTIEIVEVNDVYQGTVVSSDNTKAPIGKVLLKDIQLIDGKWQGKLFAAKKGEWMDATLKEVENELAITVKAGMFRKTIEWSRE